MRMVHLLLIASLMLFLGWFVGLMGGLNVHTGWILLVVSWWFGMTWCYAWYGVSHHHRRPT
jgi:hypothetical protein